MKTFTPVLLFKNRILNKLLLFVLSFSLINTTFSQVAVPAPCNTDVPFINAEVKNVKDIVYPNCPNKNGSVTVGFGGTFTGDYTIMVMYKPLDKHPSSVSLQPYYGPNSVVTGTRTNNLQPFYVTFTGLDPNYYCFVIVSGGKCANIDIPLFCSPCSFDVTYSASIDCFSPTTTLTVNPSPMNGVGALEFSLNGITYQESNVFPNVAPGNYTLYVRNYFPTNMWYLPHFPLQECIKTFPVKIARPDDCLNGNVCTYTQGYYGNKGGKSCFGNAKVSTADQIKLSIESWANDEIVLGVGSRSVVVKTDDIDNIILYLPGGQSSKGFTHNQPIDFSSPQFYQLYVDQKEKTINSQILGQTLVLGLNLKGANSLLWNVPFNDPTKSYSIQISSAVYNVLGGSKTVGDLWILANQALAGGDTKGLSLSQISDAVDRVNNAFNGCITINGNSYKPYSCEDAPNPKKNEALSEELTIATVATKLAVTASPNPYRDNIRFMIETNVTGKAVLEVYNVLGVKVATPFEGNMIAGQKQVVNFKPTAAKGGGLFYILKIGDKQVTGKLLSAQ